jgi:signal-transduction protein with cAMP-binding, CBS, and nucleotidyltransferase domain
MPMRTLSVMQAKRFGVWTISRDANLKVVAREMVDRNISGLVVVDEEGYLEGLITRTDLVRAAHDSREWMQKTAGDYMVRNVVTVRLEDMLERVMELLIEHHVHRVVAVEPHDGKLRPIAVLSAADVVYHMAQERHHHT